MALAQHCRERRMKARRLVPWREAQAQLQKDVSIAPGGLLNFAAFVDAISFSPGHVRELVIPPGCHAEAADLSPSDAAFCLQGLHDRTNCILANVCNSHMLLDANGCLELVLSSERPKSVKNWVQLDNITCMLVPRLYFTDLRKKRT